jgi:hypothetical protein
MLMPFVTSYLRETRFKQLPVTNNCGLSNESRCLEDEGRILKNHAVPSKPALPTELKSMSRLFIHITWPVMVITSSCCGVSLTILHYSLFFDMTEFDFTYTAIISSFKIRYYTLYLDGTTMEVLLGLE